MSNEIPFTIEHLRKYSGIEQSVGGTIDEMRSIRVNNEHHSITGVIELILQSKENEELFFKKHTQAPTEKATSSDDITMLHNREGLVHNIIYNQINRNLVPKLMGRITNPRYDCYVLFTEFIKGPTAEDRFRQLEAEISNSSNGKKQELEEERLRLIRTGFKHIARFNGLCHSYRKRFPILSGLGWDQESVYKKTNNGKKARVINYLLRSVHFRRFGGDVFQENDGEYGELFDDKNKAHREKVLSYIDKEYGINLITEVDELFKIEEIFKTEVRYQHGDSRPHHHVYDPSRDKYIICDLEDFSPNKRHSDIVTYTGPEYSQPPMEEIPSLLAYYLLLSIAWEEKSRKVRVKEVEKIDETDPRDIQKLLGQKVPVGDFADFTVGFLAYTLQQDVILDGIRKKYSEKLLRRYCPGLTINEIHELRPKHIQESYQGLTSIGDINVFDSCSTPNEAREYFFRFGKLLEKLELAEIDNLGVLEKGSQWSLYFDTNKKIK